MARGEGADNESSCSRYVIEMGGPTRRRVQCTGAFSCQSCFSDSLFREHNITHRQYLLSTSIVPGIVLSTGIIMLVNFQPTFRLSQSWLSAQEGRRPWKQAGWPKGRQIPSHCGCLCPSLLGALRRTMESPRATSEYKGPRFQSGQNSPSRLLILIL